MESAIEATGLAKRFGRTTAVDGVDLVVPAGVVYGLLGPNGAGKTTTIRMLATLVRPDGGCARVLGHDVVREAAAVRGCISLTGQFAAVDRDLTAFENLVLIGRLLGYTRRGARSRAAELLEAFGLAGAASVQAAQLSGGMRRRLDIAAGIVTTPDVLFLDEPTTGLDPSSRRQVWEIVRAIVGEGTTVLLTTQYLDEADQLAERIAVLGHGKVIAEGTSAELKASVGHGALRVRLVDPARRDAAAAVLSRALGVGIDGPDPATITARLDGPGAAGRAARALDDLERAGIPVGAFSLSEPTLDEVFFALTGRGAAPQKEAA